MERKGTSGIMINQSYKIIIKPFPKEIGKELHIKNPIIDEIDLVSKCWNERGKMLKNTHSYPVVSFKRTEEGMLYFAFINNKKIGVFFDKEVIE